MRRRMVIALACAGLLCLGPAPQARAQRGGGLGGRGGSIRYAARAAALAADDDETPWNAGFGGGPNSSTGSKQVATVNQNAGTSPRGSSLTRSGSNDGSAGSAESGSNPVWLLVGLSKYLTEQQQVTMWVTMTSERATESGQKIQVSSQQITYVQRPDKLAVEVSTDKARTRIVYDGSGVTVLDTTRNLYGTIALQGTLGSVLDTLAAGYGMAVPADDLLCKGAYSRIKEKIKLAKDLGLETLGGVSCYHVAFMGEDVDCQVWFQSGDEPIPRKVVIVHRNAPGRPRRMLEVTRWETGPIPASVFKAEVPAGAQRINILPR